MTTDVVTFTPDQNVTEAMQPAGGAGGRRRARWSTAATVVGMLSTGDLIVEEARVHFPSVVNFFGVNVTLPFEHQKLDDSVAKALGATVGEVMTAEPVTIARRRQRRGRGHRSCTTSDVSRLPVVDGDGALVGIVSRGRHRQGHRAGHRRGRRRTGRRPGADA